MAEKARCGLSHGDWFGPDRNSADWPAERPTGEQCRTHDMVCVGATRWAAAYYPQMGGYVASCWVEIVRPGDCFRALVYHDGDWPFLGDRVPRELHHCDAGQFLEFGRVVLRIHNEWGET